MAALHVCARVLQTTTTIPSLVTRVGFGEDSLKLPAPGRHQQTLPVVQLKHLQNDQKNCEENENKRRKMWISVVEIKYLCAKCLFLVCIRKNIM